MDALGEIIAKAKRAGKRIVLPEGDDPRVAEGAVRAARDGLAEIVLLGTPGVMDKHVRDAGGDPARLELIDPASSSKLSVYADAYHDLGKHKGVTPRQAREAAADALTQAALMVRAGDADGTVGGAVATTPDTVRAALQVIGRAPGVRSVSSFFLMILDAGHHDPKRVLCFADCALIVEPSADELADIAMTSADSFHVLSGEEPKVAMLSFSTAGSAKHPRVERVQQAYAKVQARNPSFPVFGDIQFDAAVVPEIGARKAPEAPLNGDANVLIFPTLEAANIGYKIAQRIGGAKAIGPVLQGLAKPANDLSRGCDASDVYHLIAITSLQAGGL